ncbi:MAG TPA: hypothetical protein VNR11_09420 [Xanthobacteraceae bacterium]|nr:hypothetical protein [Xanthobacteraceae bacterium]
MTRTFTALAAAAAVAIAAVAAPKPAEARNRGAAIAAGVIGGIAAGALIAGATRPSYGYPAYYGGPAYYGAPAYYPAAPVYGPACHWRRERIWDGYGWRVRRVRVCY